jgi:hypothetical protein
MFLPYASTIYYYAGSKSHLQKQQKKKFAKTRLTLWAYQLMFQIKTRSQKITAINNSSVTNFYDIIVFFLKEYFGGPTSHEHFTDYLVRK